MSKAMPKEVLKVIKSTDDPDLESLLHSYYYPEEDPKEEPEETPKEDDPKGEPEETKEEEEVKVEEENQETKQEPQNKEEEEEPEYKRLYDELKKQNESLTNDLKEVKETISKSSSFGYTSSSKNRGDAPSEPKSGFDRLRGQ